MLGFDSAPQEGFVERDGAADEAQTPTNTTVERDRMLPDLVLQIIIPA